MKRRKERKKEVCLSKIETSIKSTIRQCSHFASRQLSLFQPVVTKKIIFSFALIILCITNGRGQKPIIGLDLLNSQGTAKISFEIKQGFIVIKSWLGGVLPLNLIYDTGAENTIIFDKEIALLLGMEFERQIPIMGSDLDSILIANIARNIKIKVEGCEMAIRDIIVLEENHLMIKEKLGVEINGIIGGSFFSNLVVKIDYRRREITLIHPDKFKHPSPKYQKLKLDVKSNKPYVHAELKIRQGISTKVKLLVDTGAALAFLIHSNTDPSLQLPDQIMLGNLGFGLSGIIQGYRGKSHKLLLGNYEFNDIVTSFQNLDLDTSHLTRKLIRNGILGNTILERFTVIIDYSKETMFLKARRKYNRAFDYDKSGLTIFTVGASLNQFFIVSVLKDSPAAIVDIRPGDLIIKIGVRKTKKIGLHSIIRKLSRKSGKKIKMTILREGIKIKKEFILNEWFRDTRIIINSNSFQQI